MLQKRRNFFEKSIGTSKSITSGYMDCINKDWFLIVCCSTRTEGRQMNLEGNRFKTVERRELFIQCIVKHWSLTHYECLKFSWIQRTTELINRRDICIGLLNTEKKYYWFLKSQPQTGKILWGCIIKWDFWMVSLCGYHTKGN